MLYNVYECDKKTPMILLFVCKANIVRSYMAEAILKEKLRRMNISGITVLSAGLLDMRGAPADPTAEKILDESGFPLPGHHSKLLDGDLVEKADRIIAMENSIKETILSMYPEAKEKVSLLKTFSRDYNGVDIDIRDPYRQSIFSYRFCFSEIYLAVNGLLKDICNTENEISSPENQPKDGDRLMIKSGG